MPLRTGYLYDADGARVAKGTITTMSCDPTANGFQITENYVLGPSGEELSMVDGTNTWQRTNVYVGGRLTATYDLAGLHFHLSDPLGTRRVQLSGNLTSGNQISSGQTQPLGQAELDCLPSQPPDCSGLPSTRSLGSTLVFRRHFAQNYPLLAQDGSMRIFSSNSSPERASNLPRSLPRKNDPPFLRTFCSPFPNNNIIINHL